MKKNGLGMKYLFDNTSVKYKTLGGENSISTNFIGDINNNIVPGKFSVKTGKAIKQFILLGNPL